MFLLPAPVTGECHLNGRIGWVDEDEIESAGEKRI
jgi:hypothetical protein